MRRHRTITLPRLKDDVRRELRDVAREGVAGDALRARIPAIAESAAPRDEEVLFSLARHSPSLREDVRANLVLALVRALEDELARIASRGPDYLELSDKGIGCGC
jgi:hypothetical protein